MIISSRGETNIFLEQGDEADEAFKRNEMRHRANLANALGDWKALYNLFDVVMVQNQKLRELVETVRTDKKNDDERLQKILQHLDESTKIINQKDTYIRALEYAQEEYRKREVIHATQIAQLQKKLAEIDSKETQHIQNDNVQGQLQQQQQQTCYQSQGNCFIPIGSLLNNQGHSYIQNNLTSQAPIVSQQNQTSYQSNQFSQSLQQKFPPNMSNQSSSEVLIPHFNSTQINSSNISSICNQSYRKKIEQILSRDQHKNLVIDQSKKNISSHQQQQSQHTQQNASISNNSNIKNCQIENNEISSCSSSTDTKQPVIKRTISVSVSNQQQSYHHQSSLSNIQLKTNEAHSATNRECTPQTTNNAHSTNHIGNNVNNLKLNLSQMHNKNGAAFNKSKQQDNSISDQNRNISTHKRTTSKENNYISEFKNAYHHDSGKKSNNTSYTKSSKQGHLLSSSKKKQGSSQQYNLQQNTSTRNTDLINKSLHSNDISEQQRSVSPIELNNQQKINQVNSSSTFLTPKSTAEKQQQQQQQQQIQKRNLKLNNNVQDAGTPQPLNNNIYNNAPSSMTSPATRFPIPNPSQQSQSKQIQIHKFNYQIPNGTDQSSILSYSPLSQFQSTAPQSMFANVSNTSYRYNTPSLQPSRSQINLNDCQSLNSTPNNNRNLALAPSRSQLLLDTSNVSITGNKTKNQDHLLVRDFQVPSLETCNNALRKPKEANNNKSQVYSQNKIITIQSQSDNEYPNTKHQRFTSQGNNHIEFSTKAPSPPSSVMHSTTIQNVQEQPNVCNQQFTSKLPSKEVIENSLFCQVNTAGQGQKQITNEQPKDNSLFSQSNYNFSNIIQTIGGNTSTKCKKDSIFSITAPSSPINNQYHSNQNKYVHNNQDNQFPIGDYEFPTGDQENQLTLQETSLQSSCMLVNNENSNVYLNTLEALTTPPLTDHHQLLTKYSNINLKIKDFSSKKAIFTKDAPSQSADYIPSKLFEEFFITGPSNQDVFNSIRSSNSDKISSIDAKVLYHFRGSPSRNSTSHHSTYGSNLTAAALTDSNVGSNSYSSQSKIINEFSFPFGCQVKQLKMSNSFSSINEILFANNSTEQGSSSVSCFVLAFRQGSDQFPTSHSFNANNAKILALLEKMNPSKTLYCVCFKVKDFIESTKLESSKISNSGTSSTQLLKSHSTSNMSKTRMKFWQTEKVYTFVTYFPLVKFFLRIITNILNIVKIKRIKTYNERLDSIPNTLANIDSDFFTQTFINIAEKTFSDLLSQDIPNFNSIIEAKIDYERIQEKIPIASEANKLEIEWGVLKAMRQFDLNNLLFLFLSLLLEHSLVFVSKDATLLTSTLMLFQNSLIRPLKWVHPMVFTLPEKLLPILGSPVPILVGINKDSSYIKKMKLDQEFNNCLFIQLGNQQNLKVMNANIVTDITLDIFNEIKEKIEPSYKRMISLILNGDSLQEAEESKAKEVCYYLIEAMSQYLQNEIFNKMPLYPIYCPSQPDLLDYEAITQKTISQIGKHKSFIKTLCKTQMMTYYMEERYSTKSLNA